MAAGLMRRQQVKPYVKPLIQLSPDQELVNKFFPWVGMAIALAGCSNIPDKGQITLRSEAPVPAAPKPTSPVGPISPVVPSPAVVVLQVKPTYSVPPYPDARTGEALITRLLPVGAKDRYGWATDIFAAFAAMQIVPSADNICAVIAVIEQESSFQADPAVAGLPSIVRREMERRRRTYNIPKWLMDNALAMKSPDGSTFNQRISKLKTENDINRLYEDMASVLPLGSRLLAEFNPVHTGGPMQVSVGFARSHIKEWHYPYVVEGSLRNELFTRRGGVYFGIAHLLAYRTTYDKMIFRFADFSAGQYASRNAAFQQNVQSLTGIRLDLDGDLLHYRNGVVDTAPSHTMQAVLSLASRINMSSADITNDLHQEKSFSFEKTRLYERIFMLTEQTLHHMPANAQLPEIKLQGPKISRKLTTAWYAKTVDSRYQRCSQRSSRSG